MGNIIEYAFNRVYHILSSLDDDGENITNILQHGCFVQ